MYATIRRYEGTDKARSEEIAGKVTESLLPSISKLPGFSGYFMIDGGEGVLTSVGLFETSDQAHASTRLAATWIREAGLVDALPNTPTITAGPLIAQGRPAAAPAKPVLVEA